MTPRYKCSLQFQTSNYVFSHLFLDPMNFVSFYILNNENLHWDCFLVMIFGSRVPIVELQPFVFHKVLLKKNEVQLCTP